jgi:hypothetical protein
MRTVLKVLLVLVGTAVLAGAAVFSWIKLAPRRVPEGQPALATLTPDSLAAFRDSFNAAAGEVRVLAMLSPT